jgi:ribosomal protein L24E
MKLLLIIFAVFGCAAAQVGVYRQPLIRVESRKEKMIKAGTWDAYYKDKQLLEESMDTGFYNMQDFDEVSYVARLSIGTPGQSFKFHYVFSTIGSWITGISCGIEPNPTPHCAAFCFNPNATSSFCDPSCTPGNGTTTVAPETINRACNQKSKYDSTKSSTNYQPEKPSNYYADYEFGYVTAASAGEDIVILDAADTIPNNLSVIKSLIGQANELSPVFVDTPFDGILQLDSFLQDAKEIKKIFTVYLQEDDTKYDVPGGYITFGGNDTEHCSSEIENQSDMSEYRFLIYNISFDPSENSNQNMELTYQVEVDMARSSIVGPPEIIKSLKEAANVNGDGKIDCDAEIKDLSIQVRNENGFKILTVPGKHLKIRNPDGSCNIALESMPPNSTPDWIFGIPWFKSYCNIFSYDKRNIGFAKIFV